MIVAILLNRKGCGASSVLTQSRSDSARVFAGHFSDQPTLALRIV